ncbi:efflux RND transporter periplasmic adaptor subunit [Algiphilus sp.]|uniref:efflux RND transporter periplasmic adaptor subunit n=1 Tax=Algiphilus sp. TaxID=1872431 RepID=UPI003B51717D
MPRHSSAILIPAWAAGLLGLTLLLGACAQEESAQAEPPPPRAVRAVQPEPAPAFPDIRVTGRLELRDEQRLAFRVPGIVEKVAVRAGDRVTQGQLLARLDTTEVDAAVEQAEAAADKALRDLERGRRLRAESVITQQQLDDLETAYEVARAQLRSARFNQRHAVIRAPADGVVLRRLVEDNETVAGGQPVLAVGNVGGGFVLAASLPDREALRVGVGDSAHVTLSAYPDITLSGAVSEIGRQADPRTGTFDIDIALDAEQAPQLASGLLASARIRTVERDDTHSSIPLAALVEKRSQGALIFRLSDDAQRVMAQTVRVRWFGDGRAVLEDPLPEDARIVTAGAGFLRDGEAVRLLD